MKLAETGQTGPMLMAGDNYLRSTLMDVSKKSKSMTRNYEIRRQIQSNSAAFDTQGAILPQTVSEPHKRLFESIEGSLRRRGPSLAHVVKKRAPLGTIQATHGQ